MGQPVIIQCCGGSDTAATLQRLEQLLMATQDQVNALTAQLTQIGDSLTAAAAGLRADVDSLKAQIAALSVPVDFSALDASVARIGDATTALGALDAETALAESAPAEPVSETPAEPAPEVAP